MAANRTGRKFYREISIMRGFALLLVTIGHSFPVGPAGVSPWIAGRFTVSYIYYFHMALFMFLAGFVASRKLYSPDSGVKAETLKSAKRLLVPYFVYSLSIFVLKQIFSVYAENPFDTSEFWRILLGRSPHGGMWYLWTLFVLSFFTLLLSRRVRRDAVFLCLGVALQILYLAVPLGFLSNMARMAVFYLAGAVVARHYDRAAERYAAFIGSRPVAILLPAAALAAIGAVTFAYLGTGMREYIYPFTAVLGIYAFLDISLRITRHDRRSGKFLDEIGDYSYDLYLLSYFVQIPIRVVGYTILGLPYGIVVAAMLILGVLLPYLASRFVLRRSRFLSAALLGRWG